MLAVCDNRFNKQHHYFVKHDISSLMIENYMSKSYNFELFFNLNTNLYKNDFLNKAKKLGFNTSKFQNLTKSNLEKFVEKYKSKINVNANPLQSIPLSSALPRNMSDYLSDFMGAIDDLQGYMLSLPDEVQSQIDYYYNNEVDVCIYNNILLVLNNSEVLLLTNEIQLYVTNKQVFIHVETDKNHRKYKNLDTYIFPESDQLKIISYNVDKKKIFRKGVFKPNESYSFEYRRNYHELIYSVEKPDGTWTDLQFTTYYPMDPDHRTTSIILSSNDEKVKVGRKIIGANKETLFETDNDEVVINKLDNEHVKNRKTAIYGYKVGKLENGTDCIIKLFLPADSKIVQPYPMDGQIIQHQKFRCDKAIVVEIQDMNYQTLPDLVAKSCIYDKKGLDYIVGKEVIPDGFNENRNETCGQGIHFHVYPEYCHYWEKSNDFRVTTEQRPVEKADESVLSSLLGCMSIGNKEKDD